MSLMPSGSETVYLGLGAALLGLVLGIDLALTFISLKGYLVLGRN